MRNSRHRQLLMTTAPVEADQQRAEANNQFTAAWRMEFPVLDSLQLNYKRYEYFVYSQCLPAWLLLLLRAVMGGMCLTVFLHVAIATPVLGVRRTPLATAVNDSSTTTAATDQVGKGHFFLCFLTMWSYLLITAYFVTALMNTLSFCFCRQLASQSGFSLAAGGFKTRVNLEATGCGSESADPMRYCLQLQWLLCGLASNASLVVTAGYFGVVYRFVRQLDPRPINWVNVMLHGCNLTFMFIEVACSGVPVRLAHLLYTIAYAAVYVLFSVLYWIPDSTNILYRVLLDWNKPGLTLGLLCATLFIGVPIVQLLWWLVYVVRCLLGAALMRAQGNSRQRRTSLESDAHV